MKIGIIGYKGHSLKLLKILLKNKIISKILVYVRRDKKVRQLSKNNNLNKIIYTSNFDDLLKLKVAFIASSSDSHVSYIKKFVHKKIYLFCEKPPCTSLNEYNFLRKLDNNIKKRIYFNFNFKKSQLHEDIRNVIKSNKFGKPIQIFINISHGLAFKKNYKVNLKLNRSNLFHNISGNLGIHYVNLLENYFGKSLISVINLRSISNKRSFDTANIDIKFKNNTTASIFLTYASPHSQSIKLYFTNSIVEYNNKTLMLFYPRDVFNNKGLYKSPKKKILCKYEVSFAESSLINSLNFFVDTVFYKKNFSIKNFNQNIDSSHTLLKSKFFSN